MNLNLKSNCKINQVITILVLTTLFVTAFAPGLHLYGGESGSVWVLKEVIDHDPAKEVESANRKRKGVFNYEVNYSRGSFTHKRTYTGETESRKPYSDAVHGESMTLKGEWSSPPRIMRPGEQYPVDFYLGVAEDNSSFYSTGAYAWTSINGTKLKNSYVKLNSKTNWKPTNETIILEPQEGWAEGQKLVLSFYMCSNFVTKTVYQYEWMKAPEASKVESPAPYRSEPKEAKPEPAPTQEIDYEVPKDEDGNYIDSGCRFNNLGGEVLVRRGDDVLGWEFAQPGMVIYEGDVIYTKGPDSSAEFVLSDLTTFKMKPDSQIVVVTTSGKEDKLKLLAGKVWTNLKQMVTEGTMDVEMSQAVAGIKGTTFIVEETGSGSVLKVLDGEVELRTNDGDRLQVKGGLMATVEKGSLTGFEPFSKDEENNSWDLQNQAWAEKSNEVEDKDNKGQIYASTEGDFYPLASDDFSYSTLEGWETVNGTWQVEDGVLAQTSNYYKGSLKGGTYAVTGSPNWTNYSVSSRIMSKDNDKIGLVFRYLDPDNFYIFSWGKEREALLFTKVVGGETTEILRKKLAYEAEKWYQLRVDVVGNEMSAYIDDEKIFSVTDDDLTRGMAGPYCWGNKGSYFDDFRVAKLSQ